MEEKFKGLEDFSFNIIPELFDTMIDLLIIQQMLENPLLTRKKKNLLEHQATKLRNEFVTTFRESNEEQIKEFKSLLTEKK